jgi:hypothetical protein
VVRDLDFGADQFLDLVRPVATLKFQDDAILVKSITLDFLPATYCFRVEMNLS